MELRTYWQILRRRLWIPLLLLVLVGSISLFTRQPTAASYAATLRFTIIVESQSAPEQYTYDGYYAWVSSEYLTDLLSVIVRSQNFATDVNARLEANGHAVRLPGGIIQAQTIHRTLQLDLSWPNQTELGQLVEAISATLQQDMGKFLADPNLPATFITPIDIQVTPVAQAPSLTQQLDLPIRLVLALLAGIGLVFLWHYLDPSVRSAGELESIGITVLSCIPRHRQRG